MNSVWQHLIGLVVGGGLVIGAYYALHPYGLRWDLRRYWRSRRARKEDRDG